MASNVRALIDMQLKGIALLPVLAAIAFGLAALGAGFGLGFVGAAGLAAISENPKMQSSVFIIVGMVESIAIYGIVMMFIILGQS
jgi:V/A-type H+-transporting ATPase subunit K